MNNASAAPQEATRRPRGARRAVWAALAALIAGGMALMAYNDVPTEVTPDNTAYAARILRETGHADLVGKVQAAGFDDQVAAVLAVQDAVLSIAPNNQGIPLGRPRELRDLYQARSGLCFDRSRAIETILSSLGFEVRHVSVYSTKETESPLLPLLTPKTRSHAVTEVKTERGWLVIDSNRRWIGLTADGTPVDLDSLREKKADQAWDSGIEEPMSPILGKPYTYLYGVYSRHGQFYSPYMPIPDVDWAQVHHNLD